MLTGTVKIWNADRGVGFIARDDGGHDVSVRSNALTTNGFKALATGQRVRFIVERGDRCPRAGIVEPLM